MIIRYIIKFLFSRMSDSKSGSKDNLNESNMPLLSEEANEKAGDTPEKVR